MAARLRPSCSAHQAVVPRARMVNFRHSSLPSSRVARAGISNVADVSKHSSKPLTSDRVSLRLPEGWTRRRIELTETQNNPSSQQKSRKLALKKEPILSYEEYRNKFLKGYKAYQEERVNDYLQAGYRLEEIDWKKIKKSYEIYCKSAYNSYTIELEQDNPGFIL